MRKIIISFLLSSLLLAACEKPVIDGIEQSGNVKLTFLLTNSDPTTRATLTQYITKLNVQLFDANGQKVFSTVRTQTSSDDDFGTMQIEIPEGIYTVVAVGHSSAKSATIKSPTVCQFTASDGEKLTDTFCHCSTITVQGEQQDFSLPLYRATAMVQLHLTDEAFPQNLWYVTADYSGGSANFNPTTLEGITKSTQSERRITNDMHLHQYFTFPYMSSSGKLKITITATTSNGTVLATKTLTDVPVYRNRITTYEGNLFDDSPGEYTISDFSFLIHADWDGEDKYEF
ncbi:MAG: FimB/Mfa2 family fimbrial subunit [Prevotella sp.]|nr:FimB/Mfa2 family fimbrial subunit [Prevotella sp.]